MKILITERQFDLIMESGEMVEPYPIKKTNINSNNGRYNIKGVFDVTSDDGKILDTIQIHLDISKMGLSKLWDFGCKSDLLYADIFFQSNIPNKKYKMTNINKQYKIISTVVNFIKKNISKIGLVDLINFKAEGSTEKEKRQKKLFYNSYLRQFEDYKLMNSEFYKIILDEDHAKLIHKDLYDCIADKIDNPHKIIELHIKNGSGHYLDLSNMPIKTLGNVEYVGRLNLAGCTSLTSLGNLRRVLESAILKDCTSLTSLGNLEYVWVGLLDLRNCSSLKDLGKLKTVGDVIYINESPLLDMYKSGELEMLYPHLKEKIRIVP
jgi:hypothetical protein